MSETETLQPVETAVTVTTGIADSLTTDDSDDTDELPTANATISTIRAQSTETEATIDIASSSSSSTLLTTVDAGKGSNISDGESHGVNHSSSSSSISSMTRIIGDFTGNFFASACVCC